MAYSRGVKIEDNVSEEIIEAATDIVFSIGYSHLTVRSILRKLGYTNRVFYNRFCNIHEVLEKVYENVYLKMRKCIEIKYVPGTDYCEYLINLAVSLLKKTYETKMLFINFLFEHDSITNYNRKWWLSRIKELLDYGVENNVFKEFDTEAVSYSVWCFCRGFTADAVNLKLDMNEAEELFRNGLNCFLNGIVDKATV